MAMLDSPKSPHQAVGFLVTQSHFGHVANVDRIAIAHGEQLLFDLFGAAKLTQRPHDPAAFSFPIVAAGGVLVLCLQHSAHIGDASAVVRPASRDR